MKKTLLVLFTAIIAIVSVTLCACKKSDAPIVGTYKLDSVTMVNSTVNEEYTVGNENTPAYITENSFVLEIKSNYKWKMTIALPGVTETEDGKWTDENGVYALKEDKNDPVIPITYFNGKISFIMYEDGYILTVTLKKVA